MPLNCGITSGVGADCASLKRVSGVSKKAWVFNIADLRAPIGVDASGYVTALEFNAYDGLYAFESTKYSHQGTTALVVSDGGSLSYTHTVMLRLYNDNPLEDLAIENLASAEVGVILKTGNNDYLIYGASNGLSATADDQTTGRNLGEDTTTMVTLTGSEVTRPLRFRRGDAAATLQYLEALQF